MGGLCLDEADGKPKKCSVCQLLDGCGELLQCLAARLSPDLELRPISRRQLVVSESILQCPSDVLIRRFGWDTMYIILV
jgi:hypothetical protein